MTMQLRFKPTKQCLKLIRRVNPDVRHVIFDLDDTLYPEADYLLSAYRCFAEHYAPSGQVDNLNTYLCTEYLAGRRSCLFGRAVTQFGLETGLERFLQILRYEAAPPLKLYPGAGALLDHLHAQDLLVSIATNGNPDQQRRKLMLLGKADLPNNLPIMLCDLVQRKPAPQCLLALLQQTKQSASNSVMIGDNSTDQQAAQAAGIAFIDIRLIFDTSKNWGF